MIDVERPAASPDFNIAGMSRAHRLGFRRASLVAAALLSGVFMGAGGFAYAATISGRVVWDHGHRLERVQHRVHSALDSVGATTVQEDKVHDIIVSGFGSMGDSHAENETMRKQMLDLLRASTVDRAAVERLRADHVAKFDAKSKAMVGVILDSADQLTPDQRARLVDLAEAMMDHGPRGWHEDEGQGDRHGEDGEHRHGHGEMDHGRDGNPG